MIRQQLKEDRSCGLLRGFLVGGSISTKKMVVSVKAVVAWSPAGLETITS